MNTRIDITSNKALPAVAADETFDGTWPFERNEIVTGTWIKAYGAAFPTLAHAAGGIGWAKGYATGAHEFENPAPGVKTAIMKKAALAIWGAQDRTLHAEHFLPLFTQLFWTITLVMVW